MKQVGNKKMKLAALVIDYDIYPRNTISSQVVNNYAECFKSGSVFDPIRVDKKTKRIIDGVHRYKMADKTKQDTIETELYEFKDEAEVFEWAIRWNSKHGTQFTTMDRARCLLIGRKLGMDITAVSSAIGFTLPKMERIERDRIKPIEVSRSATIDTAQTVETSVVVKRPIANILEAQQKVSKELFDEQDDMGGMGAGYYLTQAAKMLNLRLVKNTPENNYRVETLLDACSKWLRENTEKAA